jgi:hypothetical protein
MSSCARAIQHSVRGARDERTAPPLHSTAEVPMAKHNQNKMPRAIQVSRKLALSSEQLVVMASPDPAEKPAKCTFFKTGCPAHTC